MFVVRSHFLSYSVKNLFKIIIRFEILLRFVYAPKKVIVRGLGIVKPQKQLNDLID